MLPGPPGAGRLGRQQTDLPACEAPGSVGNEENRKINIRNNLTKQMTMEVIKLQKEKIHLSIFEKWIKKTHTVLFHISIPLWYD